MSLAEGDYILHVLGAKVAASKAVISAELTNNGNFDLCYWKNAEESALGLEIKSASGKQFVRTRSEVPEDQSANTVLVRLPPQERVVLNSELIEPVDGAFDNVDGKFIDTYTKGDLLIVIPFVIVSDCMSKSLQMDESAKIVSVNRGVQLRY